jgi:hypothetical protein
VVKPVKAIKVRVREGRSAEVLDYNLYLSPNDVWSSKPVPRLYDCGGIDCPCLNCNSPSPLAPKEGGK